jgi:translation elongation factor P/translation initiation factor 5A
MKKFAHLFLLSTSAMLALSQTAFADDTRNVDKEIARISQRIHHLENRAGRQYHLSDGTDSDKHELKADRFMAEVKGLKERRERLLKESLRASGGLSDDAASGKTEAAAAQDAREEEPVNPVKFYPTSSGVVVGDQEESDEVIDGNAQGEGERDTDADMDGDVNDVNDGNDGNDGDDDNGKSKTNTTTTKTKTNTTTTKPKTNTSTTKPKTNTSTTKPKTNTSTTKPKTNTSTTKPKTNTSTTKPKTNTSTTKPKTNTSTTKPKTNTSTTKPKTNTSTTKPKTNTSTTKTGHRHSSTCGHRTSTNGKKDKVEPVRRERVTEIEPIRHELPTPTLHIEIKERPSIVTSTESQIEAGWVAKTYNVKYSQKGDQAKGSAKVKLKHVITKEKRKNTFKTNGSPEEVQEKLQPYFKADNIGEMMGAEDKKQANGMQKAVDIKVGKLKSSSSSTSASSSAAN